MLALHINLPPPQSGKTWMYAGCQTLFVGDALQKVGQLPLFLLLQRREQTAAVLARNTSNLGERRPSLVGQVQRITAPVVRILPSLDEPPISQVIQQFNQPAGNHIQSRRQLLLRDPRPL